jgi:hypothetical protein
VPQVSGVSSLAVRQASGVASVAFTIATGATSTGTRPRIVLAPIVGVVGGVTPITYTLYDEQGDLCSLRVEVSLDAGFSWKPATAGSGGDGTRNLRSSASGVSHVFEWYTSRDVTTPNNAVKLRLTPADAQGDGAGVLSPTMAVR